MRKNLIAKWWILHTAVIFAAAIMAHLGWWSDLWDIDQTKISFFILVIYAGIAALTGLICYKQDTEFFERNQNYVWFASESMATLGIIGTVVGLLIIFSASFGNIDIDNKDEAEKVLQGLASGMGTAFVTTIAGATCGLLTKWMMVIIETNWGDDGEALSE